MSDATKRADFIRRSLDDLWRHRDSPDVQESIEELSSSGYPRKIVDLAFDVSTYAVNDTDSESDLVITHDNLPQSLAVVALKPGETTYITATSHPLQTSLHTHYRSACTPRPTAAASVFTSRMQRPTDDSSEVHIGRPTLVLTYKDDKKIEYPSVIHHELVHMVQLLARSIRTYTYDDPDSTYVDRLNDEFEAYYHQDRAFGRGVEYLDDQSLSMACAVSSFRVRHLAASGYRLTPHTVALAKADELIRRIA